MNPEIEVRHYLTPAGEDVFSEWLLSLADSRARAKIASRIDRLTAGNFGDCKALGSGLYELRVDYGPGYRVYYAWIGRASVVLLCGGDKPDFAVEYLKAALEDDDEPRVLLIALRRLAQAQGIAKVAKAAGIERESLYRALSPRGNPCLSTLVAVARAVGLRLTVEAAH